MAGYSGKPLSQKLGIKPGFRIFADNAPKPYRDIVGELPAGAKIVARMTAAPIDMVHLFATDAAGLAGKLRHLRGRIASDGMIWVSEEGERRCDRPQRRRGARGRAAARARRRQGLRDRRGLVGLEVRDSGGAARQAHFVAARVRAAAHYDIC
jgi:hypothetical protein